MLLDACFTLFGAYRWDGGTKLLIFNSRIISFRSRTCWCSRDKRAMFFSCECILAITGWEIVVDSIACIVSGNGGNVAEGTRCLNIVWSGPAYGDLIAQLFTSVGDLDDSSFSFLFLNIDGVVNRELDLGELPSYAEHSGHAFITLRHSPFLLRRLIWIDVWTLHWPLSFVVVSTPSLVSIGLHRFAYVARALTVTKMKHKMNVSLCHLASPFWIRIAPHLYHFIGKALADKPQTYFRIPKEHRSRSDWKSVSRILEEGVGRSTLPCIKLRAVVDAAKEINDAKAAGERKKKEKK